MYRRTWHDRVINLGGTTNITGTIIRVTLLCKTLSDTIVLGRVISLGDTTNITDTISLPMYRRTWHDRVRASY
jgi:hypothetical protein